MKNSGWILATISVVLSACQNDRKVSLFNDKAALPASFKFDTLGLKVMATFVNKQLATTAVLYANELAFSSARKGDNNYSPNEIRALITWKQQADTSWLGAKIPGELQSVELIKMLPSPIGPTANYTKYKGKDLLASPDTLQQEARIKYILAQRPAIMP